MTLLGSKYVSTAVHILIIDILFHLCYKIKAEYIYGRK